MRPFQRRGRMKAQRTSSALCKLQSVSALVGAGVLFSSGALLADKAESPPAEPSSTLSLTNQRGDQSAAYDWMNVILETAARDVDRVGARPTILARAMAISVNAMYDAWAAYDPKAIGVPYGSQLSRPPSEHTQANKEEAIGYAVYRTLLDQYPHDQMWIDKQVQARQIDPANKSTDPSTPAGVGNAAAAAVIAYHHKDGANQMGDTVGSATGEPYSDYTYYRPVNPPSPGPILDPDRWQEIPFSDGEGGHYHPGFLTPHWYLVKSFGLERNDMFRPGPPPKVGTMQMKKEVDECIEFNASLSVHQKAIVEFMRDGPRSTGQSGHWLRFAQRVSRRDKNDLDTDVKMYFAVGNTAHDAFISCWDTKRHYDSSRPWSLVRYYYAGKMIKGWAGPGKGVVDLPAEEWHPYSPATFVTPPFPGYTSGHATVSGACAKMLELFTGSDRLNEVEARQAGALTEPGFKCSQIQMVDGKFTVEQQATCDAVLKMPTFSEVAEMAALSRLMGGYHIRTDNEVGVTMGRKVGEHLWPKFQALFEGRPMPVLDPMEVEKVMKMSMKES